MLYVLVNARYGAEVGVNNHKDLKVITCSQVDDVKCTRTENRI